MMQVSNVSAAGNTVQAVKTVKEQPSTATDSVSKDIQNKIMDAQKQRQELSSNMQMTAEEKADRRQKIQKEISDLKRELRQREAEEKRKQQEAEKAAEAKKERKEEASKEAVKEQQKSQSAQNADGRKENVPGSDNGRKTDDQKAEEERRENLPKVMHKGISKAAAVEQVRIVRKTAAQRDGAASVREAEISQDAARGADVESLRKEQRQEIQKEARRMEQIQTFMFGGKNSKAVDADEGVVKQFSGGVRGKGLYSNSGMMFKTNFQSVQMDLKQ